MFNMPTVKPYLSVSKTEAIAGVGGVGENKAIVPISVPHNIVSAIADTKIKLKRSLMVQKLESVQPHLGLRVYERGWCCARTFARNT
jgi:hypothetical protein